MRPCENGSARGNLSVLPKPLSSKKDACGFGAVCQDACATSLVTSKFQSLMLEKFLKTGRSTVYGKQLQAGYWTLRI